MRQGAKPGLHARRADGAARGLRRSASASRRYRPTVLGEQSICRAIPRNPTPRPAKKVEAPLLPPVSTSAASWPPLRRAHAADSHRFVVVVREALDVHHKPADRGPDDRGIRGRIHEERQRPVIRHSGQFAPEFGIVQLEPPAHGRRHDRRSVRHVEDDPGRVANRVAPFRSEAAACTRLPRRLRSRLAPAIFNLPPRCHPPFRESAQSRGSGTVCRSLDRIPMLR